MASFKYFNSCVLFWITLSKSSESCCRWEWTSIRINNFRLFFFQSSQCRVLTFLISLHKSHHELLLLLLLLLLSELELSLELWASSGATCCATAPLSLLRPSGCAALALCPAPASLAWTSASTSWLWTPASLSSSVRGLTAGPAKTRRARNSAKDGSWRSTCKQCQELRRHISWVTCIHSQICAPSRTTTTHFTQHCFHSNYSDSHWKNLNGTNQMPKMPKSCRHLQIKHFC